MASVTHYKGNPNHWIDEEDFSGLINYLFGRDRKNVVTKEQFLKLRNDLLDDIFWLEFTRYSKDGKTMRARKRTKFMTNCERDQQRIAAATRWEA